MKKLLFIIVLTLFASYQCMAAGWELVDIGGDGTIYHMHTSSLVKQGEYVKGWIRADYKNPKKTVTYDGKTIKEKEYSTSRMLYIFDCRNRKGSLNQLVLYDSTTEGLPIFNESRETDFSEIIPGSIESGAINLACKPV